MIHIAPDLPRSSELPTVSTYPLSFNQERLWFSHRLDPLSPAYNLAAAYRFRGQLDVAAFGAAFTEVIRRHEILRSLVTTNLGEAALVVGPAPATGVAFETLRDVPPGKRLAEVRRLAAREAAVPFDLAAGSPLRTRLVRLGSDDHVWLLTIHHIICDGWSVDIIWHELAALYSSFSAGQESPLPELAVQYPEYARREREWARAGLFDDNAEYWQRQLSGVSPLALPTDRPYPPFASSRGARMSLALPAALVTGLRDLARRRGATPFMAFLAAFQLLLARYCRQQDIALGLPVAGRTRREFRPLVGFFANTVVLRTDVSGRASFGDLLARTRSTVLDAIDHQDVPFQELVTRLRPPREPARPPLFQAMIAVEDPPRIPALPGIRVERLPVERGIAPFELTLGLHTSPVGTSPAGTSLAGTSPAGTSISFEYATDLFDRATIARMAGHYQLLLEGIVGDPGTRLDRLPLVTSQERSHLLAAGRGPRPRRAPAECLHQLVELQAARVPGAPAVVHADTTLSYAKLAARAGLLADHLRGLGVAPGVRVGLYADRCAGLIVGMLGILTAGGACVPISVSQPAGRISYLLRDAGVELLVLAPGLPEPAIHGRGRIVRIADDYGRPAPPLAITAGPSAHDIAFVLYTSGSTGAPKAVELPHSGLVNVFTHMVGSHEVTTHDRVLSFSAIGTDMCIEEIFLALCGGAAVVLRDEIVDTAPRFLATCQRLGLTILGLPTAYWHELAAGLPDDGTGFGPPLRLVLIGGDRASPAHLRRWLSHAGSQVRLVNAYGPTETAINVTQHGLTSDSPTEAGDQVPIGRPIPGVHVYVLDDGLQLVPAGVPGELYIGGSGVARGYLGRPALTAERFPPDPYGTEPGGRVYRTGDLARWRADGVLEFAGRADDQLKIRGFRIEPGEIVASLCQHRDVGDAVIVSREDSPGNGQLVAYVIPAAGRMLPDDYQLRAFLAERLPGYMIPAAIVPLTELPRTTTGKVDRRALPAPPRPSAGDVAARVASSPVEKLLTDLWADILSVAAVGMDDNFFDLGGHSLQAVQLAARVSAAVGSDVSVKLIIAHPTIASLAEALVDMPSETTAPRPLAVVPPAPPSPPLPGGGAADFIRFESRPLLSLIDAAELPGVDAATISCIPDAVLARRGIDLGRYVEDWIQGVPIISGIKDTQQGRVAHLVVPFPESRAYADPRGLVQAVIPTLRIARRAGATVASLINLLPSATGYGQAIQDAITGRDDVPLITTGHATTTAAVVLNVDYVLRESGRSIGDESLAFIGLGSIGLSTLRLMLRRLPHPRRIVLCDLFSRHAQLAGVQEEVRAAFTGPVELAETAAGTVPDLVYESTLIVAATNVPDVVDVDRLRPGCIVVDDSAPHCFDPDRALERLHRSADVVCVEGGELRSPDPMTEVRFVPSWVDRQVGRAQVRSWFGQDAHTIGGCVLSSLLTARFADIPVTVGPADVAAGERNHAVLARIGYTASHPELEDEVLAAGLLARFRAGFGSAGPAEG